MIKTSKFFCCVRVPFLVCQDTCLVCQYTTPNLDLPLLERYIGEKIKSINIFLF
jgi:hypothetical protein